MNTPESAASQDDVANSSSETENLQQQQDPHSVDDTIQSEPPQVIEEDIEEAYRRALEANEAIELELGLTTDDDESLETEDSLTPQTDDAEMHVDPTAVGEHSSNGPENEQSHPADEQKAGSGSDDDSSQSKDETVESSEDDSPDNSAEESASRVTPLRIIEAALFVGGPPLTTKQLSHLLRGTFDQDFVEDSISELNQQYQAEARPYEIRLVEGGYRLGLRSEYHRIQNRVFGLGPKDVKLSQEVLEVLAVVAYRQPITKQQLEELGKPNAGGSLRQLLRRELISIDRSEEDKQAIQYKTTDRFLSLFGLGDLDELPQADELSFK